MGHNQNHESQSLARVLGVYVGSLYSTQAENQWRREICRFLEQYEKSRIQLECNNTKKQRENIDNVMALLKIINRILRLIHNTPKWGNKDQLLDELVYILLSNRSKIEEAGRQFSALKKTFSSWEQVAIASPEHLRRIIYGGGLEEAKVEKILGSLLAIKKYFGRIDSRDLNELDNDELRDFLLRLPGVGPKTADCVLMYAREHDVFPADAHCIRIIDRLGIFEPLGFTWKQEQHKTAQRELSVLIPPGMRSDLHRNLIAHGRETCRPKPACHRCEIRKFCNYYRKQEQVAEQKRNAPTVVDMYCGAGGFSYGFGKAGFKIVSAVDADGIAIQTFKLNHPEIPEENVIQADTRHLDVRRIKKSLGSRRLDVLIGGPPCQGFSMIGIRVHKESRQKSKSGESFYDFDADPRNQLYIEMIRVARNLRPRYVIIENVSGLGSAHSGEETYATIIQRKLERIGYRTTYLLVKSEEVGIPQRRHRIFILGAFKNESVPDLTKLSKASGGKLTKLEDALVGLPSIVAGSSEWVMVKSRKPQSSAVKKWDKNYLSECAIESSGLIIWSHVSRYNNALDLALFEALRQGEDYRELVNRLGKQPYMRYSFKNFHDKYFRLDATQPTRTIMAHLAKDGNGYVHPTENRTISVREAARIQSFPDDYIFCGSRGQQFIQIGNAVPPLLAMRLAILLREAVPAFRRILLGDQSSE